LTVKETALPGVVLITPRVFQDERGVFFETYKTVDYAAAGINCEFVQDNVSVSTSRVIRGLHYQVPNPQAKLIQVLSGAVLDVAVDVRRGSPTFGKWVAEVLSDENRRQLFLPAGFAHGIAVLGSPAIVSYKCSTLYCQAGDAAVLWNDPDIGVAWPVDDPILSAKDAAAPRLADVPYERLPVY
jgi:dTDP-4-dehydrorhamnose 3,5-epimerase